MSLSTMHANLFVLATELRPCCPPFIPPPYQLNDALGNIVSWSSFAADDAHSGDHCLALFRGHGLQGLVAMNYSKHTAF